MTVPFITDPEFSRIQDIKHAFFTRQGGVSEGIYASLNTGVGSKDNPEHVQENRLRVVQAMGGENPEMLHSLYQIHSDKVVSVSGPCTQRQEADALVTRTPDVMLGILTADCTPVLFADETAQVIGASHAGWKGAWGGILENTVRQMEALGADRARIRAVIGPTIQQTSYEVGPEFVDRFIKENKDFVRFFIQSVKQGHAMFDLPAYVTYRLQSFDVNSVTNVGRDTCAEEDTFFSYRRTCLRGETDYGRNISVIMLGS